MTKKEFATAFGCRSSEVTKWLSGQQNFTIRTLAKLSIFFEEPLVVINSRKKLSSMIKDNYK